MKTKTIDICAKDWFDKPNGNSYFAGVIVVNYGLQTQYTLYMPFQYGHGDMYLQIAASMLKMSLPLSLSCRDKGIILRNYKIENCLKRDVIRFGEEL